MKSKLDILRDRKEKLETVIHQDTNEWNPVTLKSFQAAQRNAQKELGQINMEIGNILLNTSKVIYLQRNDPLAGQILKDIKNSDRFVTVDFLVIEKMVVNKIWPDKTSDFRFMTDTSLYVDKVLMDIGLQIGAQFLDRVTLKAKHLGTKINKVDAIYNVESIIEQSFGQELKALYLVKGIYDAVSALDKEDTKTVIFNLPTDVKDFSNFIKEFRTQNIDLHPYSAELLGKIPTKVDAKEVSTKVEATQNTETKAPKAIKTKAVKPTKETGDQ